MCSGSAGKTAPVTRNTVNTQAIKDKSVRSIGESEVWGMVPVIVEAAGEPGRVAKGFTALRPEGLPDADPGPRLHGERYPRPRARLTPV